MGSGFLIRLLRQPAPEQPAFKERDDEKEDVGEEDKDERGNQNAGILLAAEGSPADMDAHADAIEQHAQVEVEQQGGVLREADPGFPREETAGVDDAEQRVQRQQSEIHQEHDAGDVQHHPAADTDAAAPGQTGAGAEVLKRLHERLVLSALDKTVVGDAVNLQAEAVLTAERLHLLQEAKHVGGDAVHIERQAENDAVRAAELLQDAGVIRRGAQLLGHLLTAREQPLQGEEIRRSAEALFRAAVDEYRLHSAASNSAGSARNTTSDR